MAASPRRNALIDYFVHHRTAGNLLLVLLVLAGIVAGSQVRTQYFPDTANDSIRVTTSWSGAAPQDMDQGVVALLEPTLRGVDGVSEVQTRAREGWSRIDIEFESGWDMSQASDDVKAAIDSVTTLPEDANDPQIRRSSYWDRVTDVVISGPVPIDQLVRYADRLRDQLFAAGIARTSVRGAPKPIIRVAANDAQLERYGLSLAELSTRIGNESELIAIGELDAGTRVRAGDLRRDAKAIADIALLTDATGKQLKVGDVATVAFDDNSRGEVYEVGGKPAIILRVERGLSDDAIDIQRQVEAIVAGFRPTLPEGSRVQLTGARAEAISDRLDILWRNGLMGLGLVLCLLFLFLSARTAFWVAAGIPVAMTTAVALMYLTGTTLNMVSLFALIITLGIVVDDAIVVGEHADALAAKGYPADEAASMAATRMAGPVLAASITTIIAFASLLLIDGRMGRFILDIPITVTLVLIASLVECFLILPAHMRHALAKDQGQAWYDAPSRTVNRGFIRMREGAFRPALAWVLQWRYPALGAAICLLFITAALFRDGSVGWRFFNAPERGSISANIAMLPGFERADTRAMLNEMQRALDVVNARYEADHGASPVKSIVATIGDGAGRGLRSGDDRDEDLLGGLSIELIDADERPYSVFEFIRVWEDEIVSQPAVEIMALIGERSGQGGEAIDIQLNGRDLATLKAASLAIQDRLRAFEGVSGLEDTLASGQPEINLRLTPQGEALGFDTAMVATALRHRLAGITAYEFAMGPRSGKIMVETDDKLTNMAYLDEVRIKSPSGDYVPLRAIATFSTRPSFDTIRRFNGLNTVSISSDVAGDDDAAANNITRALAEEIMPDIAARFDIDYTLAGLAEEEREFLSDAVIGTFAALVCIYVVLAWIFASWVQPILILLVVPFGAIGMIWGHYVHDVPLSMFSIVGAIGMIGIIINDSIVLITAANQQTPSRAVIPTLVDAASGRLRAVMLTTLTTVFGLAPLLFETSRQAQFLKPTVITLAYGLGFGMIMVLIITPIMLAIRHDIDRSLNSMRRSWRTWRRWRLMHH